MDEKMILEIHEAEPIKGEVVRIHKETLDIVQQLQAETGLTASKIISECIKFASQHYEIREHKRGRRYE